MNRENLQTLATFLAHGNGVSKGVRFDMGLFTEGDVHDSVCKTAGCAVGFAPFAGIEKRPYETFAEYSERTLIYTDDDEWAWCFSADWASIDNTRLGAAKRIQYLLDNGMPDDFYAPEEFLTDLYTNTEVKQL